MICNTNKKLVITFGVLFLVLSLFACGVSATVSNSDVSDSNVYGWTTMYNIAINPIDSTSSGMEHLSGEYIHLESLQPSSNTAVPNQNVTLTPIKQRGSAVYMDNGVPTNGYTFTYGDGGHAVAGNPFVVAYTSFGTKNVTLGLRGWDGMQVIPLSASTSISVGFGSISVSNSTMGYQDMVSLNSAFSDPSVVKSVQWLVSMNPLDNNSWSENYITSSRNFNASFGSTAGISAGNYTFKMIITTTDGTVYDTYKDFEFYDVKVTVYHIPIIESMSVTSCADVRTAIKVSANTIISEATIDNYKWEYSYDGGIHWVNMGINGKSGTYSHLSTTGSTLGTYHDVGNYLIRLTLNTSEGYTLISSDYTCSIISLTIGTVSETSILRGDIVELSVTSSNLIPTQNYYYLIQYSSDGNVWKNVGSQGTLTTEVPSETKNVMMSNLGLNYMRIHAWNNGEFDYYSYNNVTVTVIAPPKFVVTNNNQSDGVTKGYMILNMTHENDGTGLQWDWQVSTNSGSSWSNIANSHNKESITPETDVANELTLYRVFGGNNDYNNIASNVVGYLYHKDKNPLTSASDISTSTADTYLIPTKTWLPYEILNTYALSESIGLVITTHALYLIDATNQNVSALSVTGTQYISYGTIADCKYYKGHLMYETTDGRIIVQSIVGSSGFGSSVEILGFAGTVIDYDLSTYNYMIAVNDAGRGLKGIYTYDIYGNMQWYIQDPTAITFAMTKSVGDNSIEYAVLASSGDKTLKAYYGESQVVTMEVPNNIAKIYTVTYGAEKVLVVTNANTLSCSYDLHIDSSGLNEFSWGQYITLATVLNHPSTDGAGNLYAGVNGKSLYVYTNDGSKTGEYPTSNDLSASDIAKTTSNYIMTGGANGQVSILQNNAGAWEGTQSIPLPNALLALSMSDSANIFLACTNAYVYCGYKVQQEESGTVLTTTYYLKITVLDSGGSPIANSGVKVQTPTDSLNLQTDSVGTVTIEVVPTKTYIISLPNGEQTITYIADNYALQYVTLKYPSTTVKDDLSYGASLRENKYIDINFANAKSNPYNVHVTIYDANKNIQAERTADSTTSFSYTFDTSKFTSKIFIVNITADPTGNYQNHVYQTYVFEVQTSTNVIENHSGGQSSTGTPSLVISKVPIIPTEMDEKWRLIIFGGLLMIIGALFSYQHSTRGCVLIAIIAGVMTYLKILPLNAVWVGCMIFLAILTVYSFAAQNEG